MDCLDKENSQLLNEKQVKLFPQKKAPLIGGNKVIFTSTLSLLTDSAVQERKFFDSADYFMAQEKDSKKPLQLDDTNSETKNNTNKSKEAYRLSTQKALQSGELDVK